ncbi:MAG: ABC transporter ATP-binding protein [Euryarchaeota archaeon]|nr:ABC transporter ATP-binding protein [Euryarchaeota archaeon]
MNAGELRCVNLGKIYEGNNEALSSVNLNIPTKGIFSIIGRNGAGKTTLIRILATLLEPSSGSATINGLDIMEDADELRKKMAVVPQEGRPIPWLTPLQTVSSYLMWRGDSYRVSRRKADEALAMVELQEVSNRLNYKLSGGMRRKTLLAMVLASDAEIIFLDEPTTGLDPISRQVIWDLLIDIGKERFLFLTTHYLEEAEAVADSIGIFDEGSLLALGNMDDLRAGMRYQYSVKVSSDIDTSMIEGIVLKSHDEQSQILTTREEAMSLSNMLISQGVQFSMNPVTLDDIFYNIAGRDIDNDYEEYGGGRM